jgi:16S rRNA (guanine527-N7)-methyltransferase
MPDVYDRLRGDGPYSVSEPLKVLDLGTGGGFPGIPLAIMFPHAEFTLCDSIGKKIIVATEVYKGAGLQNVKTVNARAETLPETFDFVVSRAVTSLENFMPWVKGKYSEGILYLKGGDLAEEISTAMAKFKMKKGSVGMWPISRWTSDPFFETKYVIHIEK